MIKLYNPWKAFLRFRTSRGFGIHSPFAYYFVLRVLREKYPYYAFADICRFAKICKQSPKEACLIFRIVNFYNPDVIYTFGCDDVVTLKAMLMVNSELTMASIPIPKVESYDNAKNQTCLFWRLLANFGKSTNICKGIIRIFLTQHS